MNTLRLAIRNVGRNRRRSILAVISVALSMLFILCMQGWIGGVMGSMVKNYTKNETGHIRIATPKFEEKYKFLPVTDNIAQPDTIIQKIRSNAAIAPHLVTVTPRIVFGVLLSNNGNNQAAMAFAGEAENEKDLLMLEKSVLPGGRAITGAREAIIGATLAGRLGFKVGDTLKIVTSGSDYALRMKKATIVGIFKTGINSLDENMFQIPIESARELLGMENQAQQIIVMIRNWRDADRIAGDIRAALQDSGISVTSWTQIGDYYRLVRMSETIYQFIYLVVAFLGAFIVSNIMMMVVMERRREIGVLKSMGMTRKDILALFLFEGMVLGIIGSISGVLAGLAIIIPLGIVGIDLTAMMSAMDFPIDNVIYPRITIIHVLITLGIGTVVSALVSLLPSRRAAQLNAIEAIKSV